MFPTNNSKNYIIPSRFKANIVSNTLRETVEKKQENPEIFFFSFLPVERKLFLLSNVFLRLNLFSSFRIRSSLELKKIFKFQFQTNNVNNKKKVQLKISRFRFVFSQRGFHLFKQQNPVVIPSRGKAGFNFRLCVFPRFVSKLPLKISTVFFFIRKELIKPKVTEFPAVSILFVE